MSNKNAQNTINFQKQILNCFKGNYINQNPN